MFRVQENYSDMIPGAVAQRIIRANGSVAGLRTNLSLPEEDWNQIDQAIKDIVEPELTFVNAVRGRGFVNNLDNLGILMSNWYSISDVGDASESMNLRTRGDLNQQTFTLNSLPIPITHIDFQVDARWRIARENGIGQPFDVTHAARGARKVAERLETVAFNGSAITLNGVGIPGLLTHPDRVVTRAGVAAPNFINWLDPTAAGFDPVLDVIAMKAELTTLGFPYMGPYELFIPAQYASVLDEDYNPFSGKTFKQRMLGIEGIVDVKVSTGLPSGAAGAASSLALVYMARDNVLYEQGSDIVPVEWEAEGGFVSNMKVMAAMALRLQPDDNGVLGVVHFQCA